MCTLALGWYAPPPSSHPLPSDRTLPLLPTVPAYLARPRRWEAPSGPTTYSSSSLLLISRHVALSCDVKGELGRYLLHARARHEPAWGHARSTERMYSTLGQQGRRKRASCLLLYVHLSQYILLLLERPKAREAAFLARADYD